jgi:predicted dehydrogenase
MPNLSDEPASANDDPIPPVEVAQPTVVKQPTDGKRRHVRLGFLGLGWIGLNRLKSIRGQEGVEVAAIADPSAAARQEALRENPEAICLDGLQEMLAEPLDGIVIATPSGQHFDQVNEAIGRGLAVFCQKPLTRTAAEASRLVEQARKQNVLLSVDYCYRHLNGMHELRQLVSTGGLGPLFAVDLVFHNAYGPNKSWALDARQSGGGCMIDLATHLIDLSLWVTGGSRYEQIASQLYAGGAPVKDGAIEDAGFAQWLLDERTHIRVACSWNASIGRDAEIRAAFHGSSGSAILYNVNGSFYDFAVDHYQGTSCKSLAKPPDDWGGRAIQTWVDRLQTDPSFDPDVERCIQVAKILDAIYGR